MLRRCDLIAEPKLFPKSELYDHGAMAQGKDRGLRSTRV